jgi:pimeloyl-ACP methyl ester carboxylesterase
MPNRSELSATRPVITWDMRGHGRSDSPADPAEYTHAACVADMAALLDAAGTDQAVAGGLSLGGFMSLAFCLEMPDRVAALVLCDTGPGFRSDDARQRWNTRAFATADRLERDGLETYGSDTGPTAPGHRSAPGLAKAARGMLAQSSSQVIDGLASIRVPTLVLVGGQDDAFLGAADYIAAKIPGAQKVVIPDAGHMCNIDQPDLFNEAMLAFLDSLPQNAD